MRTIQEEDMITTRYFRNIHIAAAISLFLRKSPEIKSENNQIFFGFPDDGDLEKAVSQFYEGAHLSLNDYSTIHKRLVMQMRKARDNNSNREEVKR